MTLHFCDPSMSPFTFGREYDNTNDNLTNNTNEKQRQHLRFGSHRTNTPNTYDTSDDMDMNDISDDINMPINIPPQNVTTTDIISIIVIPNPIILQGHLSPHIFNPIVRQRHATNIMDLSLNSLSDAEIHNARARLREMLAGDVRIFLTIISKLN